MEFGKHSPVGVLCNDKKVTLEDLHVSSDDISLLETLFQNPNTISLSNDLRVRLEVLDKYLDIPLVQAVLRPVCFHSFHRLVQNQCTIIPASFSNNKRILELAIEHGEMETFVAAYQLHPLDVAATMLRTDNHPYLVDLAVMFDRQEIVDFLVTKNVYDEENQKMICAIAARYGRLRILQCLCEVYHFVCDVHTIRNAADEGHLEIVKYLFERKCPWDASVTAMAAKNGRLSCLQFLVENECEMDGMALFEAVKHGHYDCVVYLSNQHGPWTWNLVDTAARYGHLEIIGFLRERGYPWNTSTCAMAARYGHLYILKYLHENQCPWDYHTRVEAANQGHTDCLTYAIEHGCPSESWTTRLFNMCYRS